MPVTQEQRPDVEVNEGIPEEETWLHPLPESVIFVRILQKENGGSGLQQK